MRRSIACIIQNGSSDNSYHVVTGSGTNATAILDGFTIRGGNANGSFPDDGGGGMLNDPGDPTIRNCTFTRNSGSTFGGGLWNRNSSPSRTNGSACFEIRYESSLRSERCLYELEYVEP